MKTLAGRGYLLVSLVITLFAAAPTADAQIKRPEDPVALPSPFERSQEINFNSRFPTSGGIPIKREPRVVKEGLLAPSMQDRLEHDEFLKQSKTGLIRLLPREVYDSQTYQRPSQIEIRGGGAYFSFFHRSHEYGYGSDLELDHDKFTVGFAGADYGMLVSLGDIPLESVSEDDPRFIYMANYVAAAHEPEARREFQDFSKGRTVDGVTYRRTVPATDQTTYLVRSINYRTGDVLVAFRVTRFDDDRSAIIAWKLLRSYSTPNLR
jgi:hypothetical protein